jgi:uncharacterized protein DUF6929
MSYIYYTMVKPVITLIKTTTLQNFPSGSSINYHAGTLLLVGDDANNLLTLDTNHKQTGSFRLFNYTTRRIPKTQKPDLETSSVVTFNNKNYLLILGSASAALREKAFLLPLENGKPQLSQLTRPAFYNAALLTELSRLGIKEINIEGSTVIKEQFIISNRGNLSNKKNHLLIMNKEFVQKQEKLSLSATELIVDPFMGVSELCYLPAKDRLLIAFSSEETTNTYDDGVIGDSYVGWVNDISNKLQQPTISVDVLITHPALSKQKIEGICVEPAQDDHLVIHLVADDDKGHSQLFKMKLEGI